MRFEKQVTVKAPRQVVWDLLWDIAELVSCVPGCQSAEMVDPYARYRERIEAIRNFFRYLAGVKAQMQRLCGLKTPESLMASL